MISTRAWQVTAAPPSSSNLYLNWAQVQNANQSQALSWKCDSRGNKALPSTFSIALWAVFKKKKNWCIEDYTGLDSTQNKMQAPKTLKERALMKYLWGWHGKEWLAYHWSGFSTWAWWSKNTCSPLNTEEHYDILKCQTHLHTYKRVGMVGRRLEC